jgi:hypothetical protein
MYAPLPLTIATTRPLPLHYRTVSDVCPHRQAPAERLPATRVQNENNGFVNWSSPANVIAD